MSPILERLDGFSIDSLFWLRHQVVGPQGDPAGSPTAVIAIDEETYRRPPFNGLPKALWTPQLAQVIDRTLAAGALVIGQDIILPTSIERFVKGYDRPYLLSLRKASREGRMVLGKVQHLAKPISPFPGYSYAVGHGRNIRLVNLFRDRDGVIRRVPLAFDTAQADGGRQLQPSLPLELAARALGLEPGLVPGEAVTLGDRQLPGSEDRALLLNFATGGGGIPVYSLADLQACAEADGTAFFERAFAGKVVILGAALDVEDRKITSARLARAPDRAWFAERCAWPVMEDLYPSSVVRQSLPGTLVLATAVNNILQGTALREASRGGAFALCLGFALAAALLALVAQAAFGFTILIALSLVWTGVATLAFQQALALPLFDPVVAAVAVFAFVLGYRFTVTDRDRRLIRRAFAYYLPRPVIDRMERSGTSPALGGETRDLTVFFSDIAGFTRLCEGLSPADVVSLMNRYLDAMTEVIEAHGGFVDKYIGDAIVAVFGAPLADPDHARHAVEAALACQARIEALTPTLNLPSGRTVDSRIGINSGQALIGNIGSRRRFNYTVMGDTVNLAARLEGANKLYGSKILISDETARRLDNMIARRPLERVRVIGRRAPVLLWEALPENAQDDSIAAFECARQAMEAGDFDAAAAAYGGLAASDPTAARLEARARALAADPPADGGAPVHDLEQK